MAFALIVPLVCFLIKKGCHRVQVALLVHTTLISEEIVPILVSIARLGHIKMNSERNLAR